MYVCASEIAGNDDPGFSSPGLTAVLTTENGVESIVVANQNDIMDQDIVSGRYGFSV